MLIFLFCTPLLPTTHTHTHTNIINMSVLRYLQSLTLSFEVMTIHQAPQDLYRILF